MHPRQLALHIFLAIVAVALLAACASMGRPEGGPKDELPPVFVRANPAPGTLNFSGDRLSIYFDENIKVEDVLNKVVVSPVQKTPPRVTANGRLLSVNFQDTLIPDATYTIDFSDAVRDLNEGNILDGFAFDFSTGATRDSLVISGILLDARTLEPAQGVVVGVYSNLSDSAISTLPFNRIAKTNQYGQFVLRNLADTIYNIFAVNDVNRDYHWDSSEDVAFYDVSIRPTVEPITVTDTLRASNGSDSIAERRGVRYLPNDVLLTWFNENKRSQYLKEYRLMDSTRIVFEFGAPSDTFPSVSVLNAPGGRRSLDSIALRQWAASRDTLTYWLTDRAVMHLDTIMLEATYLRTDSLQNLSPTTDTLRIINRAFTDDAKKSKDKDKKKKSKKSLFDKLKKESDGKAEADRNTAESDSENSVEGENQSDDEENDAVEAEELIFTEISASPRGAQDVNRPLSIKASVPLAEINTDGIRLKQKIDTLWVDLGSQSIVRDSINNLLNYSLHYRWEPGAEYTLEIDSLALTDIYDHWNEPVKQAFTVKPLEEYSEITLNLSGYNPETPMVVELLSPSDEIVARKKVSPDGSVTFRYLTPGTYYARAFADRNDNGTWDTGNLTERVQPEETWYYPKKLNLRKNWDIAQSWDLNEQPLDLQKPNEIKKNRPKTKEEPPADADEYDEDSEFGGSGYGSYGPGYGSNGYGSGSYGSGSYGSSSGRLGSY